jgi:Ran GTPase-activating protein (RanGAP) involved in mRNA processing and transport
VGKIMIKCVKLRTDSANKNGSQVTMRQSVDFNQMMTLMKKRELMMRMKMMMKTLIKMTKMRRVTIISDKRQGLLTVKQILKSINAILYISRF